MIPITSSNFVVVIRKSPYWIGKFFYVKYLRDEPNYQGMWSDPYDSVKAAYLAGLASMISDENPIIHIECWGKKK